MKLISTTLKVILLFTMFVGFSSCKGQIKPNEGNQFRKESSTGNLLSKLDEGVFVIFQDSKNNLWFGGNGVYKYDGEKLVLYSEKDGLVNDKVIGIQEDHLGNMYFDTQGGVSKYNGQNFSSLKVKDTDPSENEWKLDSEDLWFRMGWNSKGPYRYDGKFLYQLEFPKTEEEDKFYATYPNASFNPYGIYSIYKDSKGAIWFGTSSLGVCRYDGETVSWLFEDQMTNTPSGGSLGIRSILEDNKGYYWFTNTRYYFEILPGSTVRNGTHYINYKKHNGLGYSVKNGEVEFPYFMSIAEDEKGDLWMADEGVRRNNGDAIIHYPIKDGDVDVFVFTIYIDNEGVLWLGTNNAGVYKFNGESFEKFKS